MRKQGFEALFFVFTSPLSPPSKGELFGLVFGVLTFYILLSPLQRGRDLVFMV